MKRQLIIFGAVLSIVSCGRADIDSTEHKIVEWTFTAPATKASLAPSGDFSWDKGDGIAVWNSTGGAFLEFKSVTGNSTFTASAPDNSSFTGTAYFPYQYVTTKSDAASTFTLPSSYNAGNSLSGIGIIPMYADVEDGSNVLHFRHLCAYLTYQIPVAPASVTRVVVKGDGVSLSGAFSLVSNAGAKEIQASAGTSDVTVNYQLQGVAQMLTFTIPIPAGRYSISYTLYAGSDEVLTRSTEEITFTRAHLYKLYDSQEKTQYAIVGCETFNLSDDSGYWN